MMKHKVALVLSFLLGFDPVAGAPEVADDTTMVTTHLLKKSPSQPTAVKEEKVSPCCLCTPQPTGWGLCGCVTTLGVLVCSWLGLQACQPCRDAFCCS